MTPLITANDISVIRNDHAILQRVSLTIQQQDFITVVGPNGAGKSILLKCLIGLLQPDKGTIYRNPELTIGYVPQRLIADATIPISVQQFFQLNKPSSLEQLNKVAEETSITSLLKTPLHVLSGGELQRVLMARALLNNPNLLVLDEPAQNLDVQGQLAFYSLLEKLYKQRKLSILMVSHDLHFVMRSTNQVICLYHHVCCSGEPQAVTKDPEFISLFGDDVARMMAVYHHTHDHDHSHIHEKSNDSYIINNNATKGN